MKKLFAFTMLLAILLSSAARTVLLADFLWNYNYIVTVLCENKDKPEMHCNGKCHMAKMAAKQEESENKGKAITQLSEIISELCVSDFSFELNESPAEEYGELKCFPVAGFSDDVEHPPYDGINLM